MQLSMLKQLLSKKLINETEYHVIQKRLMKIMVSCPTLRLDGISVLYYNIINTMVGTQKEGEMEVELIKAHDPFDGSARRKIGRLRVAAYCRVSTDDEDQIKVITQWLRIIQS